MLILVYGIALDILGIGWVDRGKVNVDRVDRILTLVSTIANSRVILSYSLPATMLIKLWIFNPSGHYLFVR